MITSTNTFDYTGGAPQITSMTPDGLNRDAAIASVGGGACGPSAGYDCNGNVLTDQAGQRRFTGACPATAMAGPGDAENHLIGVTAPGVASTLSYDPIGRLNHIVTNGTATNFVWDGDDLLVEYDATSTNVLRRFIHGPGDDNPLIWFEGPYMDQNHQQSLIADHQGSIVGVTNAAGALTSSLTYDPYGSTPTFAGPRFRYTGQIAIPEIGLYYYKARFYDPVAQRFLQTDPVGYQADENLYAYVRGDPVDRADPSGLVDVEGFGAQDATLQQAAERFNPPGYTTIGAHGDPGVIQDQLSHPVQTFGPGYRSPVSAFIEQRNSRPIETLMFLACFGGTPGSKGSSLASSAANSFGKFAVASDGLVTTRSTSFLEQAGVETSFTSKTGSFGVYAPGGQKVSGISVKTITYNSISKAVSFDGKSSVKGSYTPTGSRVPVHVTCDSKGCH